MIYIRVFTDRDIGIIMTKEKKYNILCSMIMTSAIFGQRTLNALP